jgi:hypothetical protein
VGGQNVKVSVSTVWRLTQEPGLKPYKPRVKRPLSAAHRAARLAWAKARLRDPQRVWFRYVFGDQKTFRVSKRNRLSWQYTWEPRPIVEKRKAFAR